MTAQDFQKCYLQAMKLEIDLHENKQDLGGFLLNTRGCSRWFPKTIRTVNEYFALEYIGLKDIKETVDKEITHNRGTFLLSNM
jgi:hypothetical protein